MKNISYQAKTGIISLCTVILFLTSATFTFAALGGICENATIVAIGATNNNNAIKVRNDAGEDFTGWPAGASIWVVAHPDNSDAILATALTAFSLQKQVTVVAPSNSYANWGLATQVFTNL